MYKLIWNKIKYFGRKNLLVYITSKCNYHCSHCFYLKKLNIVEDYLSIENVKKMLPHFPKFRYLSFTGGEPFIRDDIKELAFLFVEQLDVEELEVNTNGSFTDKIDNFCKDYLSRYSKTKLLIQFSLLGPAHIHDAITGITDSFKRLDETVSSIRTFNKKYKNIDLCFCVPVMRSNYREFPFLLHYAYKNNIKIKFSPLKSLTKTVYTETDLCNPYFVVNDDSLFLNNDEYANFIVDVEKESKKYKYALWPKKDRLRNYAYLFVKAGHCLGECRFRKDNLVIFPNGDYSACEILKPIGNIIYDNGNFRFSKYRLQDLIKRTKKCLCAHGSYLFRNMRGLGKYVYYPNKTLS